MLVDSKPIAEPIDVETLKMLQRFILNAGLFTPEERHTLIKLFEYLILPRYAPIEEDYIKLHGKTT